MIALTVTQLDKSFGVNPVLQNISLTLGEGRRMGLVGANGSGKSTLLKIIAGLEEADRGWVSVMKGLRVGYLTQYADVGSGRTVWMEMERVFEPVRRMEARLRQLEQQIAAAPAGEDQRSLLAQYGELSRRFEEADGFSADSRIAGVLNGLGFSKERQQGPSDVLSGGERTRLGLARILLEAPDILLLDEPTNHLDLDAMQWLEDTLGKYRGVVITVSHDRYFLDAVCDCVGHLANRRLVMYEGNYTAFQERYSQDFEQQSKLYAMQQKEVARQKAIIARYKMYNTEASHVKARSREKALEKMELIDAPESERGVRFSFEARRRTGEDVLMAEGLQKGYEGRTLFQDVNMHIRAGERVALIGGNGAGKSTLLKILAGQIQADRGHFWWGSNVDLGYYDQHQQALSRHKTVLDEVWDDFRLMEPHEVRGALALFLIQGEDVFQTMDTLSGGERGRVALTKLMLKRDNVLLMDEPTNHLDMQSREVLEQALAGYTGTLLFVSHDRYFINRLADRVLDMREGGLFEYLGNYDDYVKRRAGDASPEEEGPQKTRTEIAKERKKARLARDEVRQMRARLAELERRIADAEGELERLEGRMADPQLYQDPENARQAALSHQKMQDEIEELYARWSELGEELEDQE